MRGNPIANFVDNSFILLVNTVFCECYRNQYIVGSLIKRSFRPRQMFQDFSLILSLLPIQKGRKVVYLQNVDTSLYRHESTF